MLNTTKPYRLDDWVSIDGIEGKVIEIDWRATHLRTSQGGTVVIPNSVAAKAKILNLNRTIDIHQISISVSVPAQVRPRLVLDALNRTLQGVSALLPSPKAKVTVKSSDLHTVEYEISGYVSAQSNKTEVRNLMFDLAHHHLQAAGILRGHEAQEVAHSRQRALLDDVKIFRSLSAEEKDRLAEQMQPLAVNAGQVVLELGEVSEQLLVIATGVVSAAVPDGERFVEAGRMGPGEIMGEHGYHPRHTFTGAFHCPEFGNALSHRQATDPSLPGATQRDRQRPAQVAELPRAEQRLAAGAEAGGDQERRFPQLAAAFLSR